MALRPGVANALDYLSHIQSTASYAAAFVGAVNPLTFAGGAVIGAVIGALEAKQARFRVREALKRYDFVRLRANVTGLAPTKFTEHVLPRRLAEVLTGRTYRPHAADFQPIPIKLERTVAALERAVIPPRGPRTGPCPRQPGRMCTFTR